LENCNKKAKLLFDLKEKINTNGIEGILEVKIWQVEKSRCHPEGIKYSLQFVLIETRGEKDLYNRNFLRYDNHECQGHHKHIKGKTYPYKFTDLENLIIDFDKDAQKLLGFPLINRLEEKHYE